MSFSSGVTVVPVDADSQFEAFDLPAEVWKSMSKCNRGLNDGDIVIISSKYAAISEGRMMELSSVVISDRAKSIAEKYGLEPALAELVLEESDTILGGIHGFILSVVSGTIAPNAGFDKSNVPKGYVVQYPKDPFLTARNLRQKLIEQANNNGKTIQRLGVVLSDSRVTPTRLGTIGVAVSYAGIKPTIDMRGTPDLVGNKLVVTLRAVADQLCSAAQLVMGESNEGKPIVIIRGYGEAFADPKSDFEKRTTITPDHCLILSSLKNPIGD